MTHDLILIDIGRKKIEVIKLIRENTGMGLVQAKNMVETIPVMLLQNVTQAEAETAQSQLQMAGASVEIRSHTAITQDVSHAEQVAGLCSVVMLKSGPKKINVIKVLREHTGLGLKETKELVEAAPVVLMQNISYDVAEQIRIRLTSAGATVELRC